MWTFKLFLFKDFLGICLYLKVVRNKNAVRQGVRQSPRPESNWEHSKLCWRPRKLYILMLIPSFVILMDEPRQLTVPWKKSQAPNQVIHFIRSNDQTEAVTIKREKSDVGLLTKHCFIVMVETWDADRHGGDRMAAYFAWTAFCAAFMPFLLCFLAKRMFLRNLGSTCRKERKQTAKWAGGTQVWRWYTTPR